jgi:hypothetical protein
VDVLVKLIKEAAGMGGAAKEEGAEDKPEPRPDGKEGKVTNPLPLLKE